MADNGHEQSGSDRLDRMEAVLHMLLNDHVQFREEHKMLLQSQVLMSGSLETLRDRLDKLTADVAKLTANVEAMRENFDARLRRLEG